MTVILICLVSLAALLGLLWLLFEPQAAERPSHAEQAEIEDLLPLHCRHFSMINQLLKEDDARFIRRRAPRHLERKWRAERRRILRDYLRALKQDFAHLEHLARIVSALSPEIRGAQEWQWMYLGVKFRLLCHLVVMNIAFHGDSAQEIERLINIVAGLAGELENQMSSTAQSTSRRFA